MKTKMENLDKIDELILELHQLFNREYDDWNCSDNLCDDELCRMINAVKAYTNDLKFVRDQKINQILND